MRLSEVYVKEVILKDFWKGVKEDLLVEIGGSGLESLLGKANKIIFEKFNINPEDKVYSIVGSARFYVYPVLRDALELTKPIGDLDILIPDKQLWIDAGLEENWNAGGLYRPTEDGSVEAFSVWDPSKAGVEYEDVQVRSTQDIMADSDLISGYYFMDFQDIIDYKTKLNRDKEQQVVNLIKMYQEANVYKRVAFLKKIIDLIGWGAAVDYFDLKKIKYNK